MAKKDVWLHPTDKRSGKLPKNALLLNFCHGVLKDGASTRTGWPTLEYREGALWVYSTPIAREFSIGHTRVVGVQYRPQTSNEQPLTWFMKHVYSNRGQDAKLVYYKGLVALPTLDLPLAAITDSIIPALDVVGALTAKMWMRTPNRWRVQRSAEHYEFLIKTAKTWYAAMRKPFRYQLPDTIIGAATARLMHPPKSKHAHTQDQPEDLERMVKRLKEAVKK